MNKLFYTALILVLWSFTNSYNAQISIINGLFTAYNVNPSSLTQINILNSQSNDVEIILEGRVYNAQNQEILYVKTMPVVLKPGLNALSNSYVSFDKINYANTNQAQYVRTNNRLPSGMFKFCHNIVGITNSEDTDQNCEEVQSDLISFLTLVNPMDKDEIEVDNPVLVWSHSEPFDVLSSGEFYRLVLVEMEDDETAEAAVNSKKPLFQKDFVTSHQVAYPFDAPELERGKHYGWQIQQITNNIVVNKSEAWEFKLAPKKELVDNKYALLSRKIDGGFHTVENNVLFFAFSEEYLSSKQLSCSIIDSKGKTLEPEVIEDNGDKKEKGKVNYKKTGDNRYEVDLKELGAKPGFYTLQVLNEKEEKFLLKFLVE